MLTNGIIKEKIGKIKAGDQKGDWERAIKGIGDTGWRVKKSCRKKPKAGESCKGLSRRNIPGCVLLYKKMGSKTERRKSCQRRKRYWRRAIKEVKKTHFCNAKANLITLRRQFWTLKKLYFLSLQIFLVANRLWKLRWSHSHVCQRHTLSGIRISNISSESLIFKKGWLHNYISGKPKRIQGKTTMTIRDFCKVVVFF